MPLLSLLGVDDGEEADEEPPELLLWGSLDSSELSELPLLLLLLLLLEDDEEEFDELTGGNGGKPPLPSLPSPSSHPLESDGAIPESMVSVVPHSTSCSGMLGGGAQKL